MKVKKRYPFFVLSVKYEESPRLLGIFYFRYPRFLQKVELPEPTSDCAYRYIALLMSINNKLHYIFITSFKLTQDEITCFRIL